MNNLVHKLLVEVRLCEHVFIGNLLHLRERNKFVLQLSTQLKHVVFACLDMVWRKEVPISEGASSLNNEVVVVEHSKFLENGVSVRIFDMRDSLDVVFNEVALPEKHSQNILLERKTFLIWVIKTFLSYLVLDDYDWLQSYLAGHCLEHSEKVWEISEVISDSLLKFLCILNIGLDIANSLVLERLPPHRIVRILHYKLGCLLKKNLVVAFPGQINVISLQEHAHVWVVRITHAS